MGMELSRDDVRIYSGKVKENQSPYERTEAVVDR